MKIKSLISVASLFAIFLSGNASATLIQVTVTGDGKLVDDSNGTETPLANATMSMTYDTGDFYLAQTYGTNSGSRWLLNTPVPVLLSGGGQSISTSLVLAGARMHDVGQFSFNNQNGNDLMQWNGFSFPNPITTDFDTANNLFISLESSDPTLLSNDTVRLQPYTDGNFDLAFVIENADVSLSEVPEPSTLSLLITGLLGLGVSGRKTNRETSAERADLA